MVYEPEDRDSIDELKFEWHPRKASANLKKHKASFHEAMTILGDKRHIVAPDRVHSYDEERNLAIGLSIKGRLLTMCFTERKDPFESLAPGWPSLGKGGYMKSAAGKSKQEVELRRNFDFSKAVRGKYYGRYKKGHSVTLIGGEADLDDPLASQEGDSQLVEIAGKHLLISRLIAAGFEVAEPLRDKGIDLIVYRDENGFSASPVQMKASTQESFSLDRKYARFSNLLMAYVWNVNAGDQGEVYLLTFDQALKIMDAKGYSKTDSWMKNGYYFVRSAGKDLKELLKPYRVRFQNRQEKIPAVG